MRRVFGWPFLLSAALSAPLGFAGLRLADHRVPEGLGPTPAYFDYHVDVAHEGSALESSLRFASFEEGPCPVLRTFAADSIASINALPPSSRRLDKDTPRPRLRVVSRTPRPVPPASLDVNASARR